MKKLILAAMMAALAATPAIAGKKTTIRQLKRKDVVAMAPERATLLVRIAGDPIGLLFLKDYPADVFAAMKAEEKAKSQAYYDKALANARKNAGALRARNPRLKKSELEEAAVQAAEKEAKGKRKPAELAGPDAQFWVDPGRKVVKGEQVYLIDVPAGAYKFYSAGNTCACMGSVRFDAPAGAVTDLGTVLVERNGDTYFREFAGAGFDPAMKYAPLKIGIRPATPDATLPPQLAGKKVVPARYGAAGKTENYYGAYINRLPAMPGVLGYESDRVVDLSSAETASGM